MSEKTVLKKKGVSERETDTAAGALPAYVRGIDAESLYFFLTLYRAGSLPQAAEQMGVSLSSANRMLAKLRTYWNDPLFTRKKRVPDAANRKREEALRPRPRSDEHPGRPPA